METVWSHFRDPSDVTTLKVGGLSPKIFASSLCEGQRSKYVCSAIEFINHCPGPKVVLLDPDTGLSPPSACCPEHVSPDEIKCFWECALAKDDWLAVYQHRPRGTSNESWEALKRREAKLLEAVVGYNDFLSGASSLL